MASRNSVFNGSMVQWLNLLQAGGKLNRVSGQAALSGG